MVQSAEQKKITRGRQWSQQTHTQTKGIKTVGRIGFGAGKTSTEDESNLQHILYYIVTGKTKYLRKKKIEIRIT